MNSSPHIVIAGASGYIGKALIPRLLARFPTAQITALSRSQPASSHPQVHWKACDLFSLKKIEEALPEKIDLAYYLVHSMGPTAHLDQGSFADYDLILADNFSRAIRSTGLIQLIYLGGLVPDYRPLSLHLQSRLEVEETFASYSLPTTIFRAGLILGEDGSSFQILLKLVKRLPIMICPKWTQTLTTPVDLETVLEALTAAALGPEHLQKTYDLAGCKPLTYIEMMKETARKLGQNRAFLTVPIFTPTLSRLWVTLITNTPKALVYPLVESLEHAMVARPSHLFTAHASERNYFDLLQHQNLEIHPRPAYFRFRFQRQTVRSVQRLPLPHGRDAQWVKEQYIFWLPRFLAPFIKVKIEDHTVRMAFLFSELSLLDLKFSADRSHADRQLLYIKRGFLARPRNKGRLEFRVVLNRRFVLAAIHDFAPALPWFIYKYTQALIHLWVMRAFSRYLRSKWAT